MLRFGILVAQRVDLTKCFWVLVVAFMGGMVLEAAEESPPVAWKAPEINHAPSDNWGNDKINAHLLWQSGYMGDGITIAVLDTGVDAYHPAFYGNVPSVDDIESMSRDGQGVLLSPDDPAGLPTPIAPFDPLDYQGHGTQMASVIAATGADGATRGVA